MALVDQVIDTFPANGDTGVPLAANITITLSGLDYDSTSIQNGFIVQGNPANQLIGAGLLELSNPATLGNQLDTFVIAENSGFVAGTITITNSGGNTLITFNATNPLTANTEFTVTIASIYEADATTLISGTAYFSFTSGSGSIQEIPSTISTSVLSNCGATVSSTTPLQIVSTTPDLNAIQQSPETEEITITFNKSIDPASVTSDRILIKGYPIVEHPNLSVSYIETFAKVISVSGNTITIRI